MAHRWDCSSDPSLSEETPFFLDKPALGPQVASDSARPSSASRFPQLSTQGTKSSEEPTLRGPFDKSHISVRVITHSFVSSTDLTHGPQLPLSQSTLLPQPQDVRPRGGEQSTEPCCQTTADVWGRDQALCCTIPKIRPLQGSERGEGTLLGCCWGLGGCVPPSNPSLSLPADAQHQEGVGVASGLRRRLAL